MYLSLLKWNLYSKIKKNFINIDAFKNIPSKAIVSIFCIIKLVQMYLISITTNMVLQGDKLSIDIVYIDTILKKMQENKIILLIIFLIYILMYIIKGSIKAVNIQEESPYKEWLIINTHSSLKKIKILLIIDYLIFNSLEILTIHLPIIYSIMNYLSQSIIFSILTSIIYLFSILIIMGILCYVYNKYLSIIKKLRSSSLILFQNIYKRIVCIYVFYNIGLCFSKWLNKFPLVKNKVSSADFEEWFSNITSCVDNIILSITNMNIIKVLILNMILLISMFIVFSILNNLSWQNRKFNVRLGTRNYIPYIFKSISKSKYTFRNLSGFCGSILYWCLLGFYLGNLKYIEPGSKVFYFIVISYIFYPIYILIDYLFDKLQGDCCIDGDGLKIYHWMTTNIFKLYTGKRLYSYLSLSLIILISNLLLFFTSSCSIMLILCITICQFSFMCTIYSLFSLPSIIFPHFERSNIEELDKYLDRQQFKEMIGFFVFVMGIPLLVIPTALYLTDYIVNVRNYILIQFIGVTLLLILINYVLILYIKSRVNSKEFFNLIFER